MQSVSFIISYGLSTIIKSIIYNSILNYSASVEISQVIPIKEKEFHANFIYRWKFLEHDFRLSFFRSLIRHDWLCSRNFNSLNLFFKMKSFRSVSWHISLSSTSKCWTYSIDWDWWSLKISRVLNLRNFRCCSRSTNSWLGGRQWAHI